jgi:hypothetical protein
MRDRRSTLGNCGSCRTDLLVLGCSLQRKLADNLEAAELELSEEERRRLDEVSALPLIYPFWHQAKTASDRRGAAELSLLGPYLNDGS